MFYHAGTQHKLAYLRHHNWKSDDDATEATEIRGGIEKGGWLKTIFKKRKRKGIHIQSGSGLMKYLAMTSQVPGVFNCC